MEFHFNAYTPEELILASNFLMELAKLQQKRMVQDRLGQGQEGINPTYYPPGASRPQSSVLGGMPSPNPFSDGG